MLEKLYEAIDANVLTDEMKDSLALQFNEAVEAKAQTLAEELASEKISAVIDDMTERVEKLEALKEDEIAAIKESLEKEYSDKEAALTESIDTLLDKAIEEFVLESKVTLEESAKTAQAELLVEAVNSALVAAGVEITTILEAKDASSSEAKLAESIEKYDALMSKTIGLEKEVDNLVKLGVIAELKEGMTLVESEKFEKLAGIVDFSKDESYVNSLKMIKESVVGAVEKKEEVLEESTEKKISSAIDKRFL